MSDDNVVLHPINNSCNTAAPRPISLIFCLKIAVCIHSMDQRSIELLNTMGFLPEVTRQCNDMNSPWWQITSKRASL